MTQRAFLTAEWKQLLMLNYAVDPALLLPLIPAGTELDSFDGRTYVSLVGFEFNNTRIGGTLVPFHQSFEEVNLRFYVKRGTRRGVVFIRELVPKLAVVAVARAMFGEKYAFTRMSHSIRKHSESGLISAEYMFGAVKNSCVIRIETESASFFAPDGSLAQFITEHYWGYAAQKDGSSIEYEVQHPRWRVREAKHASFRGDARAFYGDEFARVLASPPDSAFMAEGSPVTVFRGTPISNVSAHLLSP